MITMQDALEDTSDSLDLEHIKNKITSAYQKMLEQVFKKDNPVGSPEKLAEFIEQNSLNFGEQTGDFDKDSVSIDNLLDKLLEDESLKPIAEDQKSKLQSLSTKHQKEKLGGLFA
jgi:hypothetical protein